MLTEFSGDPLPWTAPAASGADSAEGGDEGPDEASSLLDEADLSTGFEEAELPAEVPEPGPPAEADTKKKAMRRVPGQTEADSLALEPMMAKMSAEMGTGFVVCVSQKSRWRTLHGLRRCYRIPGVHYKDWIPHGLTQPDTTEYDDVCRWCWKSPEEKKADENSGDAGASTSSSSESMPDE